MAEKRKAFETLMAKLAKKHKLTTMGGGTRGLVSGAIPTPLTVLNQHILGVGGLAWERITEVFGPESSGKSSLVLGCLAAVQRAGGVGAYIDAENVATQERCDALGVNKDELIVPEDLDDAEGALQLLLDVVRAHSGAAPLLVVLDSVPALETKAQAKGDVGDAHMAQTARLMSTFMPSLVRALRGRSAHALFVNQIREKPGVMFGSPEYTPGGRALRFFATTRLRTAAVKVRDGGLEVRIKSVKSKLAEPQREMHAFLNYKTGWDDAWTTLNHAKDVGAVEAGTKDELGALAALGWGMAPDVPPPGKRRRKESAS